MSTEENIELPRGSYDLFTSIIKGFLSSGADKALISTKTVASYIGRHPTLVSQNIKALEFFGIVRKEGNAYQLTKVGADLAFSLEYNDEEGTASQFRYLINNNEFLKSVVFSVKARESVTNSQLRDDIGKRAKVTKKDPRSTIGAQTTIDILVASNFLKRENDTIIATELINELREDYREPKKETKVIEQLPVPQKIELKKRELPIQIVVQLNFNVPEHPKDTDIQEIAEAIGQIRDSLASPKEKR
jgi:hypothetical protein